MQKLTIVVVLCMAALSCSSKNPNTQKDSAHTDSRMQWWREARFGMFIHWGLYAIPAGSYEGEQIPFYSEWIMGMADIPVDIYSQYAKAFNPVKFDAAEWVNVAVEAGAKYIVITAKHHDGFSMFDTAVSDYNIVEATPFQRDPLKELHEECKKAGIAFGIYYSQLDWYHESQSKNPAYTERGAYRNAIMDPDLKNDYVDYMKAQLKELVENYDPAILWFDGEWVDWWTEEDGRDLEQFMRELKPSLVINNRVGKRGPDDGDFGTPEQEIPDTGLDYDWETCMTINDNWGYDKNDHNWKSTEVLLRNLIDIVSKGGNFLLNVGPTDEGIIPEPSVKRLREMGQWLEVNGQAVYGTSASPAKSPEWGRYTTKGNYFYAHVFDWPNDRQLDVPASSGTLKKAVLLTESGAIELEFQATETDITVQLPEQAPFEIASVVVFEFDSPFVLPLSKRVKIESVLPAYLNKDKAILALEPTESLNQNVSLQIKFSEKTTGKIPQSAVLLNVAHGTERTDHTIDISDWPDGDYSVIIREVREDGIDSGSMVRAIRKQTLPAPNLPEEPIDVGGLNMLFVDDWYIHDKENLNVVVNSPEHYPIVSESTFADYTYYRTGLARFFTDGNDTYAELVGREYFPTDEPVYYYKKSSNLKDWTLVEKEAFEVGYQQWRLKNTPPSGGNMVSKYYSNPDGNDVVYRFYEESVGAVPLSEVEIRYIGWIEGEVTWGDISLPSRNTYAVWLKSPDETVILGDPITTDKWLFGDNEIGEWHNSNDNLGTQRLIADADGLRLQFSQSRLIPRNDPFRVHYDNIWANRIQVSWTTTDGLNWEPTYFSVPDFDDAQELQHYDVQIFNQEKDNLRLAYLRMYDQAKQQIYTELLYSRNGLLWNRFPGRPRFLDNGEQGSWNFGYSMFPDREPLEHNGYLYQPTTGISCLHFMYLSAFHRTFHRDNITLSWLEGWQGGRLFGDNGLETSPVWSHYGSWDAILTDIHNARTIPGLVRIRKDGWVSLDADGTPGHIITKVLDAENNSYINGTTDSEGFITVEVLDAEGNELQGYCGQNAAVFSGDSAGHLIKWSDGRISQLPDQPIRLKITLQNAKLYSIGF